MKENSEKIANGKVGKKANAVRKKAKVVKKHQTASAHHADNSKVEIVCEQQSRKRHLVRARHTSDGEYFYSQELNLGSLDCRTSYAKKVVAEAKTRFAYSVTAPYIEGLLVRAHLASVEAQNTEAAEGFGSEPNYKLVSDEDPEKHGIYIVRGSRATRLANFIMTIDSDTTIVDDLGSERRYSGRVIIAGESFSFTIPADEWVSNEKFRSCIAKAAGHGAVFFGGREDVAQARNAIELNSHAPKRTFTSAQGWTEDNARYLTSTGYVDAEGFKKYGPEDKLRVDLSGEDAAAGLDLKRFKPRRLVKVREHIVRDFLALQTRPVVMTMVGAVGLAILEKFAENPQRAAIWLKGLTGAGKSYLLKLAMCFFGRFGLGYEGRSSPCWSWTANRIEKGGYYFKDALYGVDDYKPEFVDVRTASKIIQSYADRHARGRLQSDARTAKMYPIRGLLVCTSEDLPQSNSASLARMVVMAVSNLEKDDKRAQRCEAMATDYAGVTSDFIAWLIREKRLETFKQSVQQLKQRFKSGLETHQNCDRIAANLAMLGAAAYEFAMYLGKSRAWPTWESYATKFIDTDLIEARNTMLGLVREQQPSEVFVSELSTLINCGRVQITGMPVSLGNDELDSRQPPVGKMFERAIGISITSARAEVQKALKAQGKDELRVSESTLLDLLASEGRLLDNEGNVLRGDHKGLKTFQRVIARGAGATRVALFPTKVLLGDADQGVNLGSQLSRSLPGLAYDDDEEDGGDVNVEADDEES
jgi:hypothetical protein